MGKFKKIFIVYFQIGGRKFKKQVDADTEAEAKQVVKDSIQFDAIVENKLWNGMVKETNDICEILGIDPDVLKIK